MVYHTYSAILRHLPAFLVIFLAGCCERMSALLEQSFSHAECEDSSCYEVSSAEKSLLQLRALQSPLKSEDPSNDPLISKLQSESGVLAFDTELVNTENGLVIVPSPTPAFTEGVFAAAEYAVDVLDDPEQLPVDDVSSASPSPWLPEPANPRTFQVVGTDQPLNAQGHAAKVADCCMTGMDAWLRQYMESIGLQICQEGGFNGALSVINCNATMSFDDMNAYLKAESEWECPWLRPAGNCPAEFTWPEGCPLLEDTTGCWKSVIHRRRQCVRRRTTRVLKCCYPDNPISPTPASPMPAGQHGTCMGFI
jgi:hypothetical protein